MRARAVTALLCALVSAQLSLDARASGHSSAAAERNDRRRSRDRVARPRTCTLRFLGAAREVTGSSHLLRVGGKRLLVDCGMYQGGKKNRARNRNLDPELFEADAIILTHAHIDHSGNLPALVRGLPDMVKEGFSGKIYTTPATARVVRALLEDSAFIQGRNLEWENKKRLKRGEPPLEPTYTIEHVEQTMALLEPVELGERFEPFDGVSAQLFEAGHALGAASAAVDVELQGGTRRIAFSGDIGRNKSTLLNAPEPVPDADYVVMESTYGGRRHPPTKAIKPQLARIIRETTARDGKVIIPAFAYGRTQDIVHLLAQLYREPEFRDSLKKGLPPIYVDSPLSIKMTQAFRDVFASHPERFNDKVRDFAASVGDPFDVERLQETPDVEQSKAIAQVEGPAIIIASAGMATAGRIRHHLKNEIEDPRNTILFAGFQAPGTLGAHLKRGGKTARLFGEEYQVNARIEGLEGLSGHADQHSLLRWARRTGARKFFLVHGDFPEQMQALGAKLEAAGNEVVMPKLGDTAELE